MPTTALLLLWGLATPLAPAAPQAASAEATPAPALEWNAARAEHLWNRAGFGANSATIQRALEIGPERQVDELLRVDGWIEEPFYARKRTDGDLGKYVRGLPEDEREMKKRALRREDAAQVADFLDWWVERMVRGEEPLRERMVLFWHGHFTSSMQVVKSSYEMVQQNQLFRRHALGTFRELLHGVTRDPAMLLYLDNTSSKKSHPNENFARELLELYTLGEGNYTEEDVKEVARAFTGWSQSNGRFRIDERQHDRGKKSVLGTEKRLDGKDVVEILLRQEACAVHVAGALLAYFEGCEPEPARLESYAATLRGSGYRIDGFLRRLFLDPEFYAPEKMAQRVSSPLDYLVGCARRLGVEPDPRLIVKGSSLLGQRLFFPPSVRGWEGGRAWATGSSLLLRGALAGMLVGSVSGRELLGELGARGAEGDAPETRRLPPDLRDLGKMETLPRLNLTQRLSRGGAASDAELARGLVEEVLAVPASADLVHPAEERLAEERSASGLGDRPWSARPELAEPILREIAHEIMASPEAQLD